MVEKSLYNASTGQSMKSVLSAPELMCRPDSSSKVPGSLRWYRCPFTLGGATDDITKEGAVESDVVAVLFDDPKVFLRLLRKPAPLSDDYPKLTKWVKEAREELGKEKRVFIIVVNAAGEVRGHLKSSVFLYPSHNFLTLHSLPPPPHPHS